MFRISSGSKGVGGRIIDNIYFWHRYSISNCQILNQMKKLGIFLFLNFFSTGCSENDFVREKIAYEAVDKRKDKNWDTNSCAVSHCASNDVAYGCRKDNK